LGAATARYLAARDWHVFAADFDEKLLAEIAKEDNVTAVPLDVTSMASVEAARAAVAKVCDGLDGVVNFAGILAVGSVVEIDPATIQRVLDVNVMGTIRVNHAMFPLVLERKGRIVNISSETGWQTAMPFNGTYAMSKHAIEAYSDALRRELMFLDVPVIKIQPGPFRTAMVSSIEKNFSNAVKASSYFKETLGKLKKMTVKEQEKANDPEVLAEAVHTALTTRFPRIAYSVKPDPQRVALNKVPDWAADPLLKMMLQ
jgi:NAD(P)-dependent dehydrogenase (short-subunit alcohol dehydrogenase family)